MQFSKKKYLLHVVRCHAKWELFQSASLRGFAAGGHAKIGDFGAVRPISSEAKEFCIQSRSVLNELRSGDWRVKAGLPPSSKDEPPATSEMSLDDGVQEVMLWTSS